MNSNEIIKRINECSFSGDDLKLVDLLNELINSKKYNEYLEECFAIISLTQMYGFLSYFTEKEKKFFLEFDYYRALSYSASQIGMEYYNKGQLSFLSELEENKKIFFSAPTSFGKTAMVVEFIIENFRYLKNILFIVPTNSLLEELYCKLLMLNNQIKMGYKISTQPTLKNGARNILIVTPERFLLVREENNVDEFDLIIMDEAYKIVDSKNERISDFVQTRALRFRKVADLIAETSKKLIILSPFTYELSDSMKRFLTKYNIKKINREFEYVKRKIIKVSNSFEFKDVFDVKIKGYTKDLPISKKVKLILNQLKEEKNIVYVGKVSNSYKIIDEINWNNKTNNQRFAKFVNHLEKNYSIDENNEWKIITALKKGIGIYISALPRYIKKEIIRLYEENAIDTLIVTTAFTEGVNTSASNLIFTSLTNGSNDNKLTPIDILNASGRAGRFAKKSVGNIYCIKNDIYQNIQEIQNDSLIKLENYNYKVSSYNKIDFEIDMVDDEFLNQEDLMEKSMLEDEMRELGLSKKDLFISLNVSNKWKIILYKYFLREIKEIDDIYDCCLSILDETSENRTKALERIFIHIRLAFKNEEIDPFPFPKYEVKPFDNENNFIWGRYYRFYSSGKSSTIIHRNFKYVSNLIKEYTDKYPYVVKNKNNFGTIFENDNKKWVLKYCNDDLSLNLDYVYSETFKIISNVIQYKIPFYVSFFVSILKLFLSKEIKHKTYDVSLLDTKKISLFFEEGNIHEYYLRLADFGIPNDLIQKMSLNNITIDDIKKGNYDKNTFDEYELLLLDDFIKINYDE